MPRRLRAPRPRVAAIRQACAGPPPPLGVTDTGRPVPQVQKRTGGGESGKVRPTCPQSLCSNDGKGSDPNAGS